MTQTHISKGKAAFIPARIALHNSIKAQQVKAVMYRTLPLATLLAQVKIYQVAISPSRLDHQA